MVGIVVERKNASFKNELTDKNGNAWQLVGKVKDAHGIKGELFILIFSKDISWIDDIDTFATLASTNAELKYWTVQFVRPHKDGLILKAKGIQTRNDSELYKGHAFYISSELLVSESGDDIYLKEIEGFRVFDKEIDVGIICGFSFNGAHDLLIIQTELDKVEIPFVKELIKDIDFDNKKIIFDLPQGLCEINRN